MKDKIEINLKYEHEIIIQKGQNPKRCFVLLHGYLLDAEYIFNKLLPALNENDLVIAPNGPFLIPVKKKEIHIPKYSWYFFDPTIKTYYINFEPAADYVSQIINNYNTNNLPITIIGYSQGGYLSPKIAESNKLIDTVIGLSCSFRNESFIFNPKVNYHQIHGDADLVVKIKNSIEEWEYLKTKGNKGKFITLSNNGHKIDDDFLNELKNLV
jgi:predicted esterase